jgi:type IX secretion system PorP/SprF family membrane protein
MIRVLLLFPLFLIFGIAQAQQDPHYSQYMNNNMAINPGYAGSKEAVCLTALNRQEYVGLEGAPTTSAFTINTPIRFFKNSEKEGLRNFTSGLGLTFINEKIGFDKNLGVSFSYAYVMPIKKDDEKIGTLGIGLSGGFLNKSLNATWVVNSTEAGGLDATSDPLIPSNGTVMTFDMGFGMFYNTENMYVGLSATHINSPKVKYEKATPVLVPNYYLTAGYTLPLPNPSFDFQPSVFLGTDANYSTVADLSGVILYNKRFWGGLSYRVSSAIIGMVGIELMSSLRISYSYDFAVTDLNKYSNGTHELMVGYSFNITKEKILHKSKSVRFL